MTATIVLGVALFFVVFNPPSVRATGGSVSTAVAFAAPWLAWTSVTVALVVGLLYSAGGAR